MDRITSIFSALTSAVSSRPLSVCPFIFSFLLLFPKLVSAQVGSSWGGIFVSVWYKEMATRV